MTDDLQKRIDGRLKELATKACRFIGCSGIDPDMCQNHPQDCAIIPPRERERRTAFLPTSSRLAEGTTTLTTN